jgi:transposase-like protein
MKTANSPGHKPEALRGSTSLFTMSEDFGSEELCIRHLEQVRWPDGLRCIREGCNSQRIMTFDTKGKTGKTRHLYECVDCRYQYSVTTGTIFHNSHLPLSKWFLAIHTICSARSVSVKDLERKLKVNYRTAEYVMHRIRFTIQQGAD